MSTLRSTTLSVTIGRPWQEVYGYAADPANMPHWAAGLGSDFEQKGDLWVFRDSGGNTAHVRFTPANPFGVLDHDVFPAGQDPVHVAMRVMPNADGAVVTFLLVALPGMTDAEYDRDAAAVMADLRKLKAIMEAPAR